MHKYDNSVCDLPSLLSCNVTCTPHAARAGGLYCDCGLRSGGFTGEGVQGSSVLVMKTHNLKVQFVEGHVFSRERLPYGAAVLLVRDPRAALVAEWNREKSKRQVSHNVSNHFTYVGQEYFGEIMLKLYNH